MTASAPAAVTICSVPTVVPLGERVPEVVRAAVGIPVQPARALLERP